MKGTFHVPQSILFQHLTRLAPNNLQRPGTVNSHYKIMILTEGIIIWYLCKALVKG